MGVYVKNEEKPKDCWECFNYNCDHWGTHGYDFAETDCPLIEIVRCGECKWWTKQADSIQGRCELLKMYPSSAWYCGNGERRADPNNCKECELTNECDHHICLKAVRERRTDE